MTEKVYGTAGDPLVIFGLITDENDYEVFVELDTRPPGHTETKLEFSSNSKAHVFAILSLNSVFWGEVRVELWSDYNWYSEEHATVVRFVNEWSSTGAAFLHVQKFLAECEKLERETWN